MVCIEKRPYTLYGRLATLHFRYLTCLLDRGHITDWGGYFFGLLYTVTTSIMIETIINTNCIKSEYVTMSITSLLRR